MNGRKIGYAVFSKVQGFKIGQRGQWRQVGDQVVDWSSTDSLPNLRIYYKSLEDICEQERNYVRKAGLVSYGDYELYKSLGFGPLYNRPQDRSTGVSEWANCIVLEDYY